MAGQFPKWLYHAHRDPRLVVDAAAEDALGIGWEDSPAKHGEITAPSYDQREEMLIAANDSNDPVDLREMTKVQLVQYAADNQIAIDKIKSKAHVLAAIEDALAATELE